MSTNMPAIFVPRQNSRPRFHQKDRTARRLPAAVLSHSQSRRRISSCCNCSGTIIAMSRRDRREISPSREIPRLALASESSGQLISATKIEPRHRFGRVPGSCPAKPARAARRISAARREVRVCRRRNTSFPEPRLDRPFEVEKIELSLSTRRASAPARSASPAQEQDRADELLAAWRRKMRPISKSRRLFAPALMLRSSTHQSRHQDRPQRDVILAQRILNSTASLASSPIVCAANQSRCARFRKTKRDQLAARPSRNRSARSASTGVNRLRSRPGNSSIPKARTISSIRSTSRCRSAR